MAIGLDHGLHHLVKMGWSAAVGDKVESAFTGITVGHTVTEYFHTFAFTVLDVGTFYVSGGRFFFATEFNVVFLGAADHPFLLGYCQFVPLFEQVNPLLGVDIAATGKRLIFITHQSDAGPVIALGIFGAVHKSAQVTAVR